MKVVIVAKTRQGKGACIGGITFEGKSVRLIAAEASEFAGMEYNVGEVWEIEATTAETVIPPHIENIIVHHKRRLGMMSPLSEFIIQHMPPCEGGVEVLYEGLTQANPTGALYIAERTGIPPYSTLFWQPDQPLKRDEEAKRIRYRYPTADGGRTLTFVGFQEPVELVPAGTLLRVSLAHWWRPTDEPEMEKRCYVQLSGWFWGEAEPQIDTDEHGWEADRTRMDADVTDERGFLGKDLFFTPSPKQPKVAHPLTPSSASLETTKELLKTVFGYDEFRPLQTDIIHHLLQKRDTLAIMPTGSGKSLCYQLPALQLDGLTVVVSPLISLMQDQVDQLREWGVSAVFLNSTLSYRDYIQTAQQIRQGQVKLLYTSPETLLRPETLVLLDQSRVACITIDEAHCISTWGHDFRPIYRQLVAVRQRYPQAVCFALTATATSRVRQDIKTTLGISDAQEIVASFNRDNLFLEVQPKVDPLRQLLAFLESHREQSGIIYCATREQVDKLAAQLTHQGWSVRPYHAGLDETTRSHNQRQFIRDNVPIMVATIAFGMGINKPNVRFVMHYDLPKNLESYYQEIGRAGRDGLRADCLLLFSLGDVATIQYFISQEPPEQQPGSTIRLQQMVQYAETAVCRRQPLLTYFGETYEQEQCDLCDNCLRDDREQVDLTVSAQKFLSCVKRTGERFGINHMVDVLRGSQARHVLKWEHDKLSTYGIGREFSQKEWVHLAYQFIQQGLLVQDAEHGTLALTTKAYAVFKGQSVMGTVRIIPQAAAPEKAEYDAGLFEILRKKRKELAETADLPPYVIFPDRSLVEMATYFPQTKAAFGRMYGVGQRKLEKYAETFLPLICAYCEAHQLAEKHRPFQTAVSGAIVPSGKSKPVAIGEAYNNGRSISQLAEEFSIKPGTIIKHLLTYHQAGHPLRAEGFLEASQISAELQKQVMAAFDELGAFYLRPVYDTLNEQVSFEELHILRLYYLSRGK